VCVGSFSAQDLRDGPWAPAMLNPRNIVLAVKQVVLLYLICVGFKAYRYN
jgi:hypothetical protein